MAAVVVVFNWERKCRASWVAGIGQAPLSAGAFLALVPPGRPLRAVALLEVKAKAGRAQAVGTPHGRLLPKARPILPSPGRECRAGTS